VYERGLKPCRDRGEGFAAGADLEPRQSGLVEARPMRIAIVSEVRFRREILAEFLERDVSVLVVGLCADLAEVVALSPPLQADVVLVDADLRDGVAAARRARQIKPDIRLIAYAVRETNDDVIAWAEAGVIGYIPDTAASADLVRLIMGIHAGESVTATYAGSSVALARGGGVGSARRSLPGASIIGRARTGERAHRGAPDGRRRSGRSRALAATAAGFATLTEG
jgi:CheY-like chemotaxis protein